MPSPVRDDTVIGTLAGWPSVTGTVPAVRLIPRTRTSRSVVSRRLAASTAYTRTAPGATPVSRPLALMVATEASVVNHDTGFVTVPLTENCWVEPRTISAVLGETVREGVAGIVSV